MNKDSLLITYSSAGPIRAAMLDIGLNVGKIITRNTYKEGTIASINPKKISSNADRHKLRLARLLAGLSSQRPGKACSSINFVA